ncbi:MULTISPECIES: transposase family protein [Rothia]|uniref:transposase family protein n=2 Tax=Micrococcaceae TaxID=1268 RepID=UPI001179FC1F
MLNRQIYPQTAGSTVATPAYNRAHRYAIHHAAKQPCPTTLPGENRAADHQHPPLLLIATLFYHRHNITEELLANLFNVSQLTFSGTCSLCSVGYFLAWCLLFLPLVMDGK